MAQFQITSKILNNNESELPWNSSNNNISHSFYRLMLGIHQDFENLISYYYPQINYVNEIDHI